MIQILLGQSPAPKGKAPADIVQHRDGRLELLLEGKPLEIRVFKGKEMPAVHTVDDKTLNSHVDLLVRKAKRCPHSFKTDPPCAFNIDPGTKADGLKIGCG